MVQPETCLCVTFEVQAGFRWCSRVNPHEMLLTPSAACTAAGLWPFKVQHTFYKINVTLNRK